MYQYKAQKQHIQIFKIVVVNAAIVVFAAVISYNAFFVAGPFQPKLKNISMSFEFYTSHDNL